MVALVSNGKLLSTGAAQWQPGAFFPLSDPPVTTMSLGGLQAIMRGMHAGYGVMQQLPQGLHKYAVTLPVAGGLTGPGWDTVQSSPDIIFTDSNRTAELSGSASYETVVGLTPRTTGKYYFEVVFDTDNSSGNSPCIGLADLMSGFNVNGSFLGGSLSIGYYAFDGNVYPSGSTLATYTAGDVLGCAVDLDAGKVWFSKNGVYASGDPAAGTGEHHTFTPTEFYPASCKSTDGSKSTGKFVSADFTTAAPSGFTEWG